MNIGFETIGNATLIAYDGAPVLATDPWITGDPYFGSWTSSHDIPPEQIEAVKACRFIWISHGHPDHLSSQSLKLLRGKKILLPDHVGGLIRHNLQEQGYDVQVLPDRRWVSLSDNIRVLCIADYNQDGILLVDINGRLVVDANDASDRGWARFVRKIARRYSVSFLLRISGFGDADMIHLFNEDGTPIAPRAAKREPVGREIAYLTGQFGTRYFVPFSSMHRYQRKDSVWADQYTTTLADYPVGFESTTSELLPAFIRYDCETDQWESLNPPEKKRVVHDPKEFGDDWAESLDRSDKDKITAYFKAIEHLSRHFDFVRFKVGGQEHTVELAAKRFDRGITFEAPRHSLMICIDNTIFDDMLIGNFMKTTLHGKFPQTHLYPDFTPYVAKYADNGLARSDEELAVYFREYWRRAPFEFLRAKLERQAIDVFRSFADMDSPAYQAVKQTYHWLKRRQ